MGKYAINPQGPSDTWQWPDHVISKSDSRTLRENHNQLVDMYIDAKDLVDVVLHQLCTDSDLEDKVTAPHKYKALVYAIKLRMGKYDPRNPIYDVTAEQEQIERMTNQL